MPSTYSYEPRAAWSALLILGTAFGCAGALRNPSSSAAGVELSIPRAPEAAPAPAEERLPDTNFTEGRAAAAPEVAHSGAHWLDARRPFTDTLRGDWDTSSALLVVYNQVWQSPLQRLLVYAHDDVPVYVLATPKDARSAAFRHWFAGVPFAGLVSIALDTPWIRDYGPLEVQSQGGISWLDLVYAPNDRPRDDAVPALLGEVFETPHRAEQFHLEGGGIISNGEGLCGITESSLKELDLDADADRWDTFLQTVGCRTLARLPQLPSEATGHVDMLALFLSPGQVAIAVPTADSPPEVREALYQAREALYQAGQAHGRELEFVELPLVNQEELYYSYVNGLRTPSHYFVPSYSFVSPALEGEAHARLQRALPSVSVVGVDSDEMIESGGAIHCVTLGLKYPLSPRAHRPPGRAIRAPKGAPSGRHVGVGRG
jgi:agmatine/peptidylarginine deiminase